MSIPFDLIVVGAGAAGLAIAELAQRSGLRVALLESRDVAGADASAQQQGWFHTGALYAALPVSVFFRKMVANLDNLFDYYGGFPGMNLVRGSSIRCVRPDGWFRNLTNYYLYVHPKALPFAARPLWRLAMLRAMSRLSWFAGRDFARDLAPQMRAVAFGLPLSRCVAARRFEFGLDGIGPVLESLDRTMRGEEVLGDLLRSFLAGGGRLFLNTAAVRIEKGAVVSDGGTYRARSVVVAAGRETARLTGVPVRVVKSPILVVRPAVAGVNFVRMTPILTETLNHICHRDGSGSYSAIGNATYFPADVPVAEPAIREGMVRRVNRMLGTSIDPADTRLYFGYKTELPRLGRFRNYQDQVIDTGTCVVALPGKMSLLFSLAVRVCRHLGIDPVTGAGSPGDPLAAVPVSRSEHSRLASLISPPVVPAAA